MTTTTSKHYSEADLLETYYMLPDQSAPVMQHLRRCDDCIARYNRLEQKLRAAFASWPKGPQAPTAAPAAGTGAKPGVYSVAKDDVTQSNIYVVHGGTGVLRNNPDFYATQVMNEILSGGFSGRLMNDIRTQRGLAYGVGGGVDTNWDRPGLFQGVTIRRLIEGEWYAWKIPHNGLVSQAMAADAMALA